MNRMFLKIAGVDSKLIDKMPHDDKSWAFQIGVILFLAYVFIFMVIFFSIHYMLVDRVVEIVEGSFVFHEKIGGIKLAIGGVLSFILTTMIVMLDRTIIMSDWYYQNGYLERHSFKEKIKIAYEKIKRVVPRLIISISLAYSLSIFLLLRVYDTEISSILKDNYLKANKVTEKKIEKYKQSVELEIKKVRDDIEKTRNQLLVDSPTALWASDSYLGQLKKELEAKKKELSNLHIDKNVLDDYKALKKQAIELKNKMTLEESGQNQTKIGNKVVKASGIRGRGKRFYKLANQLKLVKNELRNRDDFKNLKRLLKNQSDIKQEIKEIEKKISKRRDEISKAYNENYIERKKILKNELINLNKRLQELIDTKKTRVKEFTNKAFKSADYKKFDDGIMVRYVVMQELFKDRVYGKSRVYFAYLLKGLLVFIELLPIIMKLFFSPPTAYSIAVQQRLKCVNEILKGESNECIERFKKSVNKIEQGGI